jgi:hypothetical protein
MTEENFEEFLRKSAQSYNTPPLRTPRAEMWQAIEAARGAGPRVVYGGGSLLRRPAESRLGSKVWWAAAAAAVVLVASGVGIGRWSASPGRTPANVVADPGSTRTTQEPTGLRSKEQTAPSPVGGRESPLPASHLPLPTSTVAITPGPIEGPAGRGKREAGSGTAASPGAASALGNAPTSAYQLAAANHLSDAEALLTSFRTRSAADQLLDAQLAAWARELLSNTRLLLDSPVAVDPQRRPLLEDLELLLVQIVQLAPGSTPQDREIIEKTLKQDHVLTRLRTAIPAGQRGS